MEHDDGGEMMDALITMIDKTYYMPKNMSGECRFTPVMIAGVVDL